MEAFLTDGLRSLVDLPVTSMGEYTVRWPGHIQRYQHTDLHPDALVEAWRYDSSRPEFTWMEVRCRAGDVEEVWTVEDTGKDGDSSMARTTGLVTVGCVLAWRDSALFSDGVHPPEDLATETIETIIEGMRQEGVSVTYVTQA